MFRSLFRGLPIPRSMVVMYRSHDRCCKWYRWRFGGIGHMSTVQFATVVPNALYLLLVVCLRPHQRWLDFLASLGVGSLLLGSSIAACTGSATIATYAALAASVVGFVPALSAPYKLVQQYRNIRRRKKMLRAERCATTAFVVVPPSEELVDDRAFEGLLRVPQSEPVAPPYPVTQFNPLPLLNKELGEDEIDEPQSAMTGNIGIMLDPLEHSSRRKTVKLETSRLDSELDELLLLTSS